MGLDIHLMHQMINGIGDRVKIGIRFLAEARYADILEGYDCKFADVLEKYFEEYFGQAINYYKGHHFQALQCVWPDKRGLFPGDPDFPENLRNKQTPVTTSERASKISREVSSHAHKFSKEEWPFRDAENTASFTTTCVVRENFPVLLVSHDEEGDWQFLCGTTNSSKDCLIVCLGCAFERDRSIGELADLPLGWQARRKSKDLPWERAPAPASE